MNNPGTKRGTRGRDSEWKGEELDSPGTTSAISSSKEAERAEMCRNEQLCALLFARKGSGTTVARLPSVRHSGGDVPHGVMKKSGDSDSIKGS
jgi:hypothetical protein